MIKFKTYLDFFLLRINKCCKRYHHEFAFSFFSKLSYLLTSRKNDVDMSSKSPTPSSENRHPSSAVCRLFDTFILITAGTAVTVHVPLARPPTSFYLTAWYAHSLFSTRTRLKVVKWFMRNIKKFSKWSRNQGRY